MHEAEPDMGFRIDQIDLGRQQQHMSLPNQFLTYPMNKFPIKIFLVFSI